MFMQWLCLEAEVVYHLGNVAASVHVPTFVQEAGHGGRGVSP